MDRRALRASHAAHAHPFLNIHSIFSNPITATVVIVVAVAYVIDRQLKPRPLDSRELLLLPLALLYFGANALWKTSITPLGVIDLVLSVAIGLYFGYRSLSSLKLYADKTYGEAVVEGSWSYLKWFVLSMLCRLLLGGLLYVADGGRASFKTAEAGFLLSTSVFIGLRSVDLYYRAGRLGIPLAQKRRSPP